MSKLLYDIKQKAIALNKTIVLAEGNDERIIRAAVDITKEKIAKIILLADKTQTESKYKELNFDGIYFFNPFKDNVDKYASALYSARKAKGMDEDTAKKLARDPLYLGVLMVHLGEADGMVAGAINATGDVLRPALQIIKTAPGISTVSSCFIMVMPEGCKYGQDGIMVFGDCAVNPEPDAGQLAAIALASAESAKKIAGLLEPRVAMLSFSTMGSAKHPLVDKVVEATKIAKGLAPNLCLEGELQLDAALVDSVAKLKAPDSKVAGKANVLIFPDLQAGNIGYKLVQRLANADAVGPICQGFNKPVNDLSRGCSIEDVVNVVAMTSLQCK